MNVVEVVEVQVEVDLWGILVLILVSSILSGITMILNQIFY